MSRIKPTSTVLEVVVLMAEGNIGATKVLSNLVHQNALAILMLDDAEIYGENIWLLYKDVYGELSDDMADGIYRGEAPARLAEVRANHGQH